MGFWLALKKRGKPLKRVSHSLVDGHIFNVGTELCYMHSIMHLCEYNGFRFHSKKKSFMVH